MTTRSSSGWGFSLPGTRGSHWSRLPSQGRGVYWDFATTGRGANWD